MQIDFQAFPLQFITNAAPYDTADPASCDAADAEALAQAQAVLDGGCRWVQLRMKDRRPETLESVARQMAELCKQFEATFIIDDHVELAKRVGATGVHLGKNDMAPAEARNLLGPDFVIGGTCNTIGDVERVKDHVDYIGCGPFRFTSTKKNLAPVLGVEGYQDIMWQMRSQGINIPVVAIGGITVDDIRTVLDAGPDGIALSGEITRAQDMTQKTQQIVERMLGMQQR